MYRQRISGVYYSTVEPRVVGLVPAGFLAKIQSFTSDSFLYVITATHH